MPELPEVETVRLGLVPVLIGRTIERVVPEQFAGVLGDYSVAEASALLVGRTFVVLRRRGKYLIFDLDDDRSIIIHLRMTGVLTFEERSAARSRFHHLAIELDGDHDLRYADQRKFGRVVPASREETGALDQKLGPEPLSDEFSAQALFEQLRRRRAPIKSLLLDQRLVAGLGNIYVDEALFRAGIHPLTSGERLSPEQIERVVETIRDVLRIGIEARGTSFSSFRDAYGGKGSNQDRLAVYGRGRAGLPCVTCGQPLQRIVVGGRGTSFCPSCQLFDDQSVSL